MLDLRFDKFAGQNEIVVGIFQHETFAAAQLLYPDTGESAYLTWFVGMEHEQAELNRFANELKIMAAKRGYRFLVSIKNPFGIGWEGTPDCWPHLDKALTINEFAVTNEWLGYYSETLSVEPLPPKYSYMIDRDELERAVKIYVFHGQEEAGEVTVWLPSILSKSLLQFGVADIEYIEVTEPFRGRRLGHAALSIVKKELERIGYRRFMLWTEPDNISMRRLAEREGFKVGPLFRWICAELP